MYMNCEQQQLEGACKYHTHTHTFGTPLLTILFRLSHYSTTILVDDTLVIHREDETVLERVTGALWALCTLKEELALTSEMTSSIGLIVGAMNRFPTRVGLQINCIGLLGVMANDVMNFVNDELVIALVSFLELDVGNDDKAVISTDTAVNIILVISNKGYTAGELLLLLICCTHHLNNYSNH